MKKINLLFIFLLILSAQSFANRNLLTAKFTKNIEGKVYLYSFYGLKTNLIDSCEVKNKKIRFRNNGNYTGFYRIQVINEYYDCILSADEETFLLFSGTKLNENIIVRKGENQILYEKFKKMKIGFRKDIETIINTDKFTVDEKRSKIKQIKQDEDSLTQSLLKKKPNSYFNATVKAILLPKINFSLLEKCDFDTLTYYKDHFFDEIDFNNTSLVRSTVLPNAYMKYFSKYVVYDESGFKSAIDIILSKSSQNQSLFTLSLEYLLELFQINGPEIIFEYIYETYYLKESCVEMDLSNETKQRIKQYKELSPGQKAPLLSDCIDITGATINLAFDAKKSTLVFFWSTHCQFCKEFLIATNKLDIKKNNVIGINIDEKKEDWINFSANHQFTFNNLHTEGSWDSPLSRRYLINKTPGIFIINEHGIITERNVSIIDAINFLNNANN